jgi:hypothetical protein
MHYSRLSITSLVYFKANFIYMLEMTISEKALISRIAHNLIVP